MKTVSSRIRAIFVLGKGKVITNLHLAANFSGRDSPLRVARQTGEAG